MYVKFSPVSGVDLGFYKDGCPIHLKRALEVEGGGVWRGAVPSPQKIFVLLISKW